MSVSASCSWFVTLPASLGSSILSNWLTVQCLGRVDSAYCNNTTRNHFLEMLVHTEIIQIDNKFPGSNLLCFLHWVSARNVTCSNFEYFLKEVECPPELGAFIENTAERLDCVQIESHYTSVALLLGYIGVAQCRLLELGIKTNGPFPAFNTRAWCAPLSTVLTNSAAVLKEFSLEQPVLRKLQFMDRLCLPSLRRVCVNISWDEDLVILCKAAPNIREICITDMYATCSEKGLAAIGQFCANLEYLQVEQGLHRITQLDTGVAALTAGCRKLKHLILHSCKSLTDVGLAAVATHCTTLSELVHSYNHNITDASIEALAASVGLHLLHLCIVDCFRITGPGLVAVAQRCPMLQSLDISSTEATVMNSMLIATPLLGSMRMLDMEYCAVDDGDLVLIAAHMPYLEYLDIVSKHRPDYALAGLTEIVHKCGCLRELRITAVEAVGQSVKEFAALNRPALKVEVSVYEGI